MWYITAFSRLTGVSVRALRHYDAIGLLKPSFRRSNDYRSYTQDDLVRLQLIIALKSMGFSLQDIKNLIEQSGNAAECLSAHKQFLDKTISSLQLASACLTDLLSHMKQSGELDTRLLLLLGEVYKMAQTLKKSGAGTLFSPDQLKRYAELQREFDQISNEEKEAYSQAWDTLVAAVKKHVHQDPYSAIGQKYARQWMDLAQQYWGQDREIGSVIWEAYKHGKLPQDAPEFEGWPAITPDVVKWIDKAVYFMFSGKKKGE